MALSDAAGRTAKGRESESKLSDGGDLYLFLKLIHGPYPLIPLADGRRDPGSVSSRSEWPARAGVAGRGDLHEIYLGVAGVAS